MPKLKKGDITASREHRLVQISHLYLQKYTIAEIAEQFNVTHTTIRSDLELIKERWLKETVQNLSELKAQELDRIGMLERVHWQEWEKKHDIRHLDGVAKCIQMRIGLLALDKPQVALPPGTVVAHEERTQVYDEAGRNLLLDVHNQSLTMLQDLHNKHREEGLGHFRTRPIYELDDLDELEEGLA